MSSLENYTIPYNSDVKTIKLKNNPDLNLFHNKTKAILLSPQTKLFNENKKGQVRQIFIIKTID
ncbi:hypothetical protein [Candidatus Nitrosocosmicus sp. T]